MNIKNLCLSESKIIGNDLVDSFNEFDDFGYWECYDPVRGSNNHFNIYSGNCGILLYLYDLYLVHPDSSYLRVIKKNIQWLIKTPVTVQDFDISLYFGHSGLIYTLSYLSQIDKSTEPFIEGLLKKSMVIFKNNSSVELLQGLSGYCFAVSIFIENFKRFDYTEFLKEILDFLFSHIKFWNKGFYFDHYPDNIAPLICLSHGSSGAIYLVNQILKVSCDSNFHWIYKNLIFFEDSFFKSNNMNWPDHRVFLSENSIDVVLDKYLKDEAMFEEKFSFSWCHGAPGIILARLESASEDELERFISIFLYNKQKILSSDSPTFCCGLSGITFVLMEVNKILNNDQIELLIEQCIYKIIDSKINNRYIGGWHNNGLENNNGLLKGDSGIGFLLLKYFNNSSKNCIFTPSLNSLGGFNLGITEFKINFPPLDYYPKLDFNDNIVNDFFYINKLNVYYDDIDLNSLKIIQFYSLFNFPLFKILFMHHNNLKSLYLLNINEAFDLYIFINPSLYFLKNKAVLLNFNLVFFEYPYLDTDSVKLIEKFQEPIKISSFFSSFSKSEVFEFWEILISYIELDFLFLSKNKTKLENINF